MARIAHLMVWGSVLFVPLALRAGLITSLGVLDGHTHSAATDINDAGVVVGASFTVTSSPPGPIPPVNRAFRYTGSGPIQALTPVGRTALPPQSTTPAISLAGRAARSQSAGSDSTGPPPAQCRTFQSPAKPTASTTAA